MSIRITQAAGILPGMDLNTGKGSSALTLAFRIRFNAMPPSGGQFNYFGGPSLTVIGGGGDSWHQTIKINGAMQLFTAAIGAPSVMVNIGDGVEFMMTYDENDSSKCAMYVNGVQTLITVADPTTFNPNVNVNFSIGDSFSDSVVDGIDFQVEDVLHLVGLALSADDAKAICGGADRTTYGAGATLRGYWSCQGTPGATVTASDAGLVNQFAPSYAPTLHLGSQAGSAMVYGDAIPYVPPLGGGDFRGYSTGKFVRVGVYKAKDGSPVVINDGGITTLPTIKINGGSPIQFASASYSSAYNGAVLWMPSGQVIPPGAAVTISTVEGWLTTAIGSLQPVTDMAIPNRAGLPVYHGDPDYPPVFKAGWNFSHSTDNGYWDVGPRNLALRIQIDPQMIIRSNGTIGSNSNRGAILSTSYANGFDDTTEPKLLGYHAMQYDDLGDLATNPTDLDIKPSRGFMAPAFQELTAYRNDGDANGVGKGRVYQLKLMDDLVVTLVDAVDAATTTLHLSSLAGLTNPANDGSASQWIKLDDEYCQINGIDAGTSTVTVGRAIKGSTAASHAASISCRIRPIAEWADLVLNLYAPDGAPNYANLAIYGPGDFTLPDPPGPIVLDRSDAYAKAPCQTARDAMANGLGVIRQMSSTQGGFDYGCEPEHLRSDADLFWAYTTKYSRSATPVKMEPATAANSPWVYLFHDVQGAPHSAQTYPVVLAADITTVPAAGAVETIKITPDVDNPIMYASRIQMPSGEIVRVVTEQVVDENVDVVRGAAGTTPAIQAAGTVQAMWRVPIGSDAIWQETRTAMVKFTCAAPHGLWNDAMVVKPRSNDLNPLARINVTLVEATDATTNPAAFKVSVAEADLPYLTYGLYIRFDDEVVMVVDPNPFDPSTGLLGVSRAAASSAPGRPTNSVAFPPRMAAHAAGTVGTGSSGSPYCKSADGTRVQWPNQPGWGGVVLVTGPDTLVMPQQIAFDLGQVWNQEGTPQTVDPQVSDGTSDFATAGPAAYNSYEYSARLTALCPGADHIVNIPQFGSDDMADAIAKVLVAGLPAGKHRVLVESGNEIWNIAFNKIYASQQMSMVLGYGQPMDYFLYRSWQQYRRVKAVFDAAGRGGEVLWYVAWQQGGMAGVCPEIATLGLADEPIVFSTAPYMLIEPDDVVTPLYATLDNETLLDFRTFYFEYCLSNHVAAGLSGDRAYINNLQTTSGRTYEFIHYEGGPDTYVPHPDTDGADWRTRNMDLNYDPANYIHCLDIPYICRRVGKSDGMAYFDLVQSPTWEPAYTVFSLWGGREWRGQIPGRGDGSDGKAINRNFLATPGVPGYKGPEVNQADACVSVREQAMLDYNAAYKAYADSQGAVVPIGMRGRPMRLVFSS